MRALVIDARIGEVREIDLPQDEAARLAMINEAVGGYFEVAYLWPSGDVLYVDEDAFRHEWKFGFVFLPRFASTYPRRLLGNGVVVGREHEDWDQYPTGWTNLDAVITADELRRLVSFFRQ